MRELGNNVPWGCDPPAYAIAATRLGKPDLAVRLLTDPNGSWTKGFAPNGQFRLGKFLPVYTPTNGALLAAVAVMAGGFDGDGGEAAPGFPRDGTWRVRAEGFARYF